MAVSMRKFYTVSITNDFYGPLDPAWDRAHKFRGTPRQIVAKVDEWRRVSGTSYVAARCEDEGVRYDDLADAVRDQEVARAIR